MTFSTYFAFTGKNVFFKILFVLVLSSTSLFTSRSAENGVHSVSLVEYHNSFGCQGGTSQEVIVVLQLGHLK
jgi:hypothetical protein